MRLFNILIFTSLFSLSAFSSENLPIISSIRDIPWTYSGTAGNLFQTQSVNLKLSELLSTKTEPVSFGAIIYNKVNGTLRVGKERTIELTDANILKFDHSPSIYTLILKTSDQFITSMTMTMRYDVITDTFILIEERHQGNRSELRLTGQL